MSESAFVSSIVTALVMVAGCSSPAASGTDSGSSANDTGGGAADVGTTVDSAIDGGPTCSAPTAGSQTFMASCGAGSSGGFATQVAIMLRPGGGASMRITGRIPGARTPCDVWDSVDVLANGTMIATLPAHGAIVSRLGDGMTAWAEGDVNPSVATLCDAAHEDQRFGSLSLVVHARTDGGSLTLTCGGSNGFPPSVILTCHQGIDPPIPDTYFRHTTTDDHTSLQATFPDVAGVTVVSIDPAIHFIRGTMPFSPTLPPVDTTGWSFSAWATQPPAPGMRAFRLFLAGASGNPLGASCPMRSTGTPPTFPPVLIARVTGMTSTGPFATDLYSEGCFSGM